MPEIRRRYPDVQLRVAGGDPTGEKTLKDKLRISSYGKYIGSLIRKYGLEKQVVFTGFLDEKTMCEAVSYTHLDVYKRQGVSRR